MFILYLPYCFTPLFVEGGGTDSLIFFLHLYREFFFLDHNFY